jgi:hypothetical protein
MQILRSAHRLTGLGVFVLSISLFAQQPGSVQRVLGIFTTPADGIGDTIIAPDKVRAGEEFQVTVTTVGGGCDEAGDNGVVAGEGTASVYVYDFTSANRPNTVCPAIIKTFRHEVPLVFDQPGQAVIRVWGRRSGRFEPQGGSPAVLEFRVQVY